MWGYFRSCESVIPTLPCPRERRRSEAPGRQQWFLPTKEPENPCLYPQEGAVLRRQRPAVVWNTGFRCSPVGKLWHPSTGGTLGGKPIFRRQLWRKDSINQSLPTAGLFHRDGIRREPVTEGGEGDSLLSEALLLAERKKQSYSLEPGHPAVLCMHL